MSSPEECHAPIHDDYLLERGLLLLHRLLSSTEFFPHVQRVFFRGHMGCGDVMLETERVRVRKQEVRDLREFVRSRERGLLTVHLGAEYSDLIHRERLLNSFEPVYRVFSLDLDCTKAGGDFFVSQAFMAALYGVSAAARFLPGSGEDDVLVCFTGGGWHVYLASDRLARVDSRVRRSMLLNLGRRPVFALRRDGTPMRTLDGHLGLQTGTKWASGDLVQISDDGTVRYVWECGRESAFLAEHEEWLLKAAASRQREWLAPCGPASSILLSVVPVASSLEVAERLRGLAKDLDAGRVRCSRSLMASLSRLQAFAASRGEDQLSLAGKGWLRAVVAYACISFDCTASGMHLDHHTGDMRQMLRAPLSAKVKAHADGTMVSYVSLPLGTPSEAVRRCWEDGSLQATDLVDSLKMDEQPVLGPALGRFFAWARRMRLSQNIAAVEGDKEGW
eukprot:296986-Hanusia_phi.AAC.1